MEMFCVNISKPMITSLLIFATIFPSWLKEYSKNWKLFLALGNLLPIDAK